MFCPYNIFMVFLLPIYHLRLSLYLGFCVFLDTSYEADICVKVNENPIQ